MDAGAHLRCARWRDYSKIGAAPVEEDAQETILLEVPCAMLENVAECTRMYLTLAGAKARVTARDTCEAFWFWVREVRCDVACALSAPVQHMFSEEGERKRYVCQKVRKKGRRARVGEKEACETGKSRSAHCDKA